MDSVSTIAKSPVSIVQMSPAIIGFVSAVIAALISAVITYFLTRKIRLEAEWRIDKLKQYQMLLLSLSNVVNSAPGEDFQQARRNFASAVNTVSLVAPQEVIDKIYEALAAISKLHIDDSNEATVKARKLIRELVLLIRSDLRIRPKDNPETFAFVLQSAEKKD